MERHSRREFLLIATKCAAASFLLACAKQGFTEKQPLDKEKINPPFTCL